MARKDGSSSNGRKRTGKLKYFYLNKNLHKSLHINRGTDTIITWCYPLHKRIAYTYSDTKIHREFAFSTQEVGQMLNRKRLTLEHAILRGHIEEPQYTYGIDESKNKYQYMWHEDNIMEMHAFLSTVHRGRPRKDGLITPAALPTVRELRAMIRQEHVMYVKNDAGEFVPVWKAPDFN